MLPVDCKLERELARKLIGQHGCGIRVQVLVRGEREAAVPNSFPDDQLERIAGRARLFMRAKPCF